MGLDSYLSVKNYVSGYDFEPEENQKQFKALLESAKLSMEDIALGCPGAYLTLTVGYWRKANAIHKWFVDNVQKGEDDCKSYYVTREQLAELLEHCKKALGDKEYAKEWLPPQEGFFFGSTEMDEGYTADLNKTIKILESVLNNPKLKGWDVYYQSSW